MIFSNNKDDEEWGITNTLMKITNNKLNEFEK